MALKETKVDNISLKARLRLEAPVFQFREANLKVFFAAEMRTEYRVYMNRSFPDYPPA